ncbi:hypothetical protein PHYBLDRAFT_145255 [Phycomyces blakesleeanus NRRL 1555(-)]|uniref:Actin-like ATPase domain-containing protein n=1 Tax=Phycomyces blakesleeanus (strain ATCC 8743b / DSM 1359 / FGSC 10004 / NBRC 33097 / NRRL 1555) TaxID=763407 RepID=A0A162XBT6_PHYB8|nr:hypothetical protein PHYBLDRAFT_145255 [Phycomyces blakesleeanus NRRL 1555(-)]OAD73785.1 hypothetical protein PHYBLDRAFT_145255 [Phycomyces blakesleeanus NRRL 1555(-)]|eukprot:XP_018291825.1 hypothetical protein PHYBLDRAFT_145255 [Phycomyces blakesleeanus NRRL 1555(-)]
MASKIYEFDFDEYPYVVGIDFGTTFSGCSYVYNKDRLDEIVDITKWPKQGCAVYPKVPTVSLYDPESNELIAWGYDAIFKANKLNNKGVYVKKFKLLLDPSNSSSTTLPEVISDYLCELYSYIHSSFKNSLGVVYNPSKFRYCLTVPAMWDDKAKRVMREAAILAGIVRRSDHPDRLILTSEPEAAALYCESKFNQFNLTKGNRFMICDAGGGTVDLIVFEIDEMFGLRSLREVTKGSGSSCGSGFLDDRMREFLINRFGEHSESNKVVIEQLINQFVIATKPEFEDEDDEFFVIPAAHSLDKKTMSEIGVVDGRFQVTVDELREDIFEPVVKQVLSLISCQLSQSETRLDAIFLVGGFGQSKYLAKRVKDTFETQVESICVPSRGELAVVRGAVMYGINPNRITHRVLRRTYGLEVHCPFDESEDSIENKMVTSDGAVRCWGRFNVFATKGECIAVDSCVEREFFIFYPDNFVSDLFAYDEDCEPPRYTTDPGVRKVAAFTTKTPVLPGIKYQQKVYFTTSMYFGRTELRVEIDIKGNKFIFTSDFDSHEL